MKKKFKGFEQVYYQETLENGLTLFMIPYPNKKNYFMSYATRYGSEVFEFTDSHKKTHQPPRGVAHFLEHKMFEQEDGVDPFTYFSKSGTDSNASTSFDSTQYICSGMKNFEGNLRYLLQYVNSPYFTKENVEKEKGIIAEEIKMYEDMPDFQLEMKLRECIYEKHPRRVDIAGEVEDIMQITKEDLYACYENFYVPNNMFLLIVGNFDPEEAKKIVEEELGKKKKKALPKVKSVKEKEEVFEKRKELSLPVEVPKIGFGLKVSTKAFKMKELELNYYLSMLTSLLFGSSSLFLDFVRKEKIMNGYYIDWEVIKDFRVFYFMANSMDPDALEKEILQAWKKMDITEEAFERMKKVWIAREVRMSDDIDAMESNSYDDIVQYGEIIPNKIDIIKKLEFQKLKEIIKKINFKNYSIVKVNCVK